MTLVGHYIDLFLFADSGRSLIKLKSRLLNGNDFVQPNLNSVCELLEQKITIMSAQVCIMDILIENIAIQLIYQEKLQELSEYDDLDFLKAAYAKHIDRVFINAFKQCATFCRLVKSRSPELTKQLWISHK